MTEIRKYCKEITVVIGQLEGMDIPAGINGRDLMEALTGLTLHRESIIQDMINHNLWDDNEVEEVETTGGKLVPNPAFRKKVLKEAEGKKPSDIKEENAYCGGGEDIPDILAMKKVREMLEKHEWEPADGMSVVGPGEGWVLDTPEGMVYIRITTGNEEMEYEKTYWKGKKQKGSD